MSAGIIILLILALLLVIFTLQNTALISLTIFFWEISDVPLVLALIVCLIAGFLISYFILYPKVWKMKSQLKSLQKQVNQSIDEPELEITNPEGIEMTGDTEESFFKD